MNLLSLLPARYQATTDPLRSERRIELVLVVLGAVVLLQLLWWGLGMLRDPGVVSVAPARDSLQVVSARDSGSISASQSLGLQARPLFWGSRRPLAPVVANEVASSSAGNGKPARRLEGFQLTGLFGAGENGGAIVTYKTERTRLSVGDEIDGWTLLSVNAEEAVFVSAGARDARRLMPLPVIATSAPAATEETPQQMPPPPRPGRTTNAAGASSASLAPARPTQNQQAGKPASLSLGGQ